MKIRHTLPIVAFIGIFCFLFVLITNNGSFENIQNKLTSAYNHENMLNIEIMDFELPLVFKADKKLTKQDLKGKIHCVVFFATWCPFCRSEHPGMLELSKKYPNLNFIAIAFKDREKKIKRYLKSNGNPYQFIMNDAKGSLAKNWGLKGIPAFYLLDTEANIRYHKSGGINEEEFDEIVYPMIKKLEADK